MKTHKFGRWIPKSKPPNNGCFCLGYFKSDAVGYSVILFSQGAFWLKKEALDQLTHWMPLPNKPLPRFSKKITKSLNKKVKL